MSSELAFILPTRISDEEVRRRVGKSYACPYCGARATRLTPDMDWVETPLRRSEPGVICTGCCIDLYHTALSPNFEDHPDRDLLESAARQEGISLAKAR